MKLSNIEIQRIYESMKWINDKGNIKDPYFISSFEKITDLHKRRASCFSLCAVSSRAIRSKKYRDMSPEAFNFIQQRINQGYKNTYHSIMAVLESHRKKNDSIDELREKKPQIYENYIHKYKINELDIPVFDEIFECAFNNTLSKIV